MDGRRRQKKQQNVTFTSKDIKKLHIYSFLPPLLSQLLNEVNIFLITHLYVLLVNTAAQQPSDGNTIGGLLHPLISANTS